MPEEILDATQDIHLDATQQADAMLGTFAQGGLGLSVIVARRGETIFKRCTGMADIEHGIAVDPDTSFHIASVSKQFTGFAVALLALEGKLDLEEDIRTYLPEMNGLPQPITVSELMHHTSGLRDQWGLLLIAGSTLQDLLSQRMILSMARRQTALNFAPGTDYEYSNTGYTLAAEIAERVSGMPLRKLLHERLFYPLGMSRTFVYDDATELVDGRAMSYATVPGGRPRLLRLNFENYGATGFQSTARDLSIWAQEMMNPTRVDPAILASMCKPAALLDGTPVQYGLGLSLAETAGRPSVGHSGADAGFRSQLVTFPADGLSVVILSNGSADVTNLAERLARIFLGSAQSDSVRVPGSELDLPALAGVYFDGFSPPMELQCVDGRLHRLTPQAPVKVSCGLDGTLNVGRPGVAFRLAENNRDLELVGIRKGQSATWQRTVREPATSADLDKLVGVYRVAELDVTYTLAVSNGALELSSLRMDPIRLISLRRNVFEAPQLYGTVLKVVDTDGCKVDRLLLSVMSGRVRDVELTRIS